MPPGEGIRVELVEEERLSGSPRDLSRPARYRAIVNCGLPVRAWKWRFAARRPAARPPPHRQGVVPWHLGHALLFRDPESTDACMVDGWLDTGDMGYVNARAICSSWAAPRT
jgi:fatty-acyl-CoA synthase